MPGLIFEAHSTDYQPAGALSALVADGFAILKVGPGLTFALREALYGLDAIAAELARRPAEGSLEQTMEELLLSNPVSWRSHYPGPPEEQRLQRHFSYSDRIRCYWPDPKAAAAVKRLLDRLGPQHPRNIDQPMPRTALPRRRRGEARTDGAHFALPPLRAVSPPTTRRQQLS